MARFGSMACVGQPTLTTGVDVDLRLLAGKQDPPRLGGKVVEN